jgi:hypothetical protein
MLHDRNLGDSISDPWRAADPIKAVQTWKASGGSFVDNQDALPSPLEVGAECYAGFSSFLYSRMSPG